MTEFTEDLNTFCIAPVIMQNHNADELLGGLQGKRERGEALVKEDLALLTLCLLMGGEMPLKDRVKAAYQITQSTASVSKDELEKAETVLYVMADKFLDSDEMDELMEVIGMTRLGQKLINEGKAEEIVEAGYEFGLSENTILDRLQKKLDIPFQKAQEYFNAFKKQVQ